MQYSEVQKFGLHTHELYVAHWQEVTLFKFKLIPSSGNRGDYGQLPFSNLPSFPSVAGATEKLLTRTGLPDRLVYKSDTYVFYGPGPRTRRWAP